MDKKKIEWLLRTKVKKMISYHKHWLISTVDHKKWMLKKIKSATHLTWWASVDRELRNRGFCSMPSFYTDGQEIVITSWIEGKVGTYRNLDQAVRLVKQLASFHQVGQHLQTPPKPAVAFLFYDRLYHRLKQFYRLMKRVEQIPGPLGRFLARYGPQFYLDGYRVWDQLQQLPLREYVHWERQHHRLAHRDLANHNWLIDKKQKIWLIDFDLAEYDSQLGDIWQMFTRIMAEHSLNDELFQRLLTSYESIRPLNDLEKEMLKILIGFPNEFMRESIGLVMNKPGYSFSSSFPYLERLAVNRLQSQLSPNS